MFKEGLVFLATRSYSGSSSIGDFLNSASQAGFFSYLLPFLLIFALVYGILTRTKIFQENRSINGIIALAVGLMALQFDMVTVFFAEIFPRLGVGLAILLVLIILTGLFIDPSRGWLMYTLLGIGVVIFLVVIINTAGDLGWPGSYWWYDNWPTVAMGVLFLIVIGVIVGAGSNKPTVPYNPIGFR
ncbi:MAG: hypothetical protein Q7R95_08500 [bacterium]|nr:hypothetical protein [bacterium]